MAISVSNAGFPVASNDFSNLFAIYKKAKAAKVVTDKTKGRSIRLGLAEMKAEAAGNEAIIKLNGHIAKGRTMYLSIWEPEEKVTGNFFYTVAAVKMLRGKRSQ